MKNGYEKTDWDFWVVTRIGAVIVTMLAVVYLAAAWTLHHFAIKPGSGSASAVERQARLPPEPRLQTNPAEDLKALREEEDSILKSSGWVDHDRGIVRIPIERAIDLTAERGLPVRQQSAPTHRETPL